MPRGHDERQLTHRVHRTQAALLALELFAFTWLARAALLLAVLSNFDKARWVIAQMSASTWSPAALAAGLECSFAVASYFLSARIQSRARIASIALLTTVTAIFALISTLANIAYFLAHTGAGTWTFTQAIALGIAAPLVALANAVLAGELAGEAEELAAQEAGAAAAAQQRAHEAELARLALEHEQQKTAQERAKDRQARRALDLVKAGQSSGSSALHPDTARSHPIPRPAMTGRQPVTLDAFLAMYPDVTDWSQWTGEDVAAVANVTARTGRRWLEQIRSTNGHHEPVG